MPQPAYTTPRDPRPLWRRLLPSSLFGRSLLIVLLPVLLAQGTAAYLFYARHWDNVSRYFASSVAGEVALLAEDFAQEAPARREALIPLAQQHLSILMKWHPSSQLDRTPEIETFDDPLFDDVGHKLRERMDYPFQFERVAGDTHVRIVVWLKDGELSFLISKKRLVSPTIEIWFMINTLVLIVVLLVAVLFLRNQMRPIVQLARAADRFGRGQELAGFQPHGAREVRMAASALLGMKERLTRMLASRTEMLAAISHDLRTPLTRMQLQLAMLEENEATLRLKRELGRMEDMITEYLEFVRGDHGEQSQHVSLQELVRELVTEYTDIGQPVSLIAPQDVVLHLRPRAFRRAIANLIDNALRYGNACQVTLDVSLTLVSLHVEDDGPGIPASAYDEVFLPFRKLDTARNENDSGAGLGLSIVREIIHAHGGKVQLAQSSMGGLHASIVLPR